MTTEEIEDIYTALWMRRNYIETGNSSLSANDAVASKQHHLIKSLEPSQKRTVARLEGLMGKFLRAKPSGHKGQESAATEADLFS